MPSSIRGQPFQGSAITRGERSESGHFRFCDHNSSNNMRKSRNYLPASNFSRAGIVWGTLLVLSSGFGAEPAPSPLSPEREKEAFHFADDQLVIELVAAEPDVISPVAIAWDSDGRLFVAEMSDYPNSPER